MSPAVMQALLAWLRPRQQPVFVLSPQAEYRRWHTAWQLPSPDDAGLAR
jgi:hypothetical protein